MRKGHQPMPVALPHTQIRSEIVLATLDSRGEATNNGRLEDQHRALSVLGIADTDQARDAGKLDALSPFSLAVRGLPPARWSEVAGERAARHDRLTLISLLLQVVLASLDPRGEGAAGG
jgi:hypothetical protein